VSADFGIGFQAVGFVAGDGRGVVKGVRLGGCCCRVRLASDLAVGEGVGGCQGLVGRGRSSRGRRRGGCCGWQADMSSRLRCGLLRGTLVRAGRGGT